MTREERLKAIKRREIAERNLKHPILRKRNFAREQYAKANKAIAQDRPRIIMNFLKGNLV